MKKETKKKQTVFVGLSGGVDSAVSAALLQKAGYEVVGVFIKTWHPDFIECNEEAERLDAMRVAAHLDIPFLTFDLEDVYKNEVADYMIREYKAGRTPNPDVMCNKEVKFGAFLKKALSMGADFVATGHYAQNKNNFLVKGVDPTKDQSYFLWTLTQEQLSKIMFPIGHLKKTEVRKLAKKFKLPVAGKHDSQGICFLGAIDLKDFLKHYIESKTGKVFDVAGQEIGHHDGAVFYTLGERHGFTITKKSSNDKPFYIIEKDIKSNILIVSKEKKIQLSHGSHSVLKTADRALEANAEESRFFPLKLEDANWTNKLPAEGKNYTAQIRYHGEFLPCKVKLKNKSEAEVIFEKSILVAGGQSCVLYDGSVCLGGGVVV